MKAGQSGPKPSCTAQTKQGTRCRSFALPGRQLCFGHDPDHQTEVRASRAKGGRLKAIRGRRTRLDTPQALATFTARLIHDVVDGTMTPDIARAATYALSLQRTLVETSLLERRIEALERQLALSAQRRAHWPA